MVRLVRRVATESNPEAVMAALLREAQRATGAASGFIGRWNEERQLLVEFISSPDTSGMPRTLPLGPASCASGRSIAASWPS